MGMTTKYAIELMDVSKKFTVPMVNKNEIREHLIRFYKRKKLEKKSFAALGDISLKISPGEFVSLIGHNGAGKSTILKLIAGIYKPTLGTVRVHGNVSPFLELGVGFNHELSVTENIFLYSAILGYSKKETKNKVDEIIDFAGIEPFRNAILKTLSSGMVVRLAFSVAIQSDAPILLVDEVLAVGDVDFRKKCFGVFERMKGQGRTIIYASHDMESVERFSDRVVFLRNGEVIYTGVPAEAIGFYLADNKVVDCYAGCY
jgi:ABC-type polysaccharide/polyol phosphate transport system ATPase subunit